jgi:hypothetical protein
MLRIHLDMKVMKLIMLMAKTQQHNILVILQDLNIFKVDC